MSKAASSSSSSSSDSNLERFHTYPASAAPTACGYTPSAPNRLHSGYFHPLLKAWNCEPVVSAADLLFPIFITQAEDAKDEIKALPGQYRWGYKRVPELLDPLVKLGLRSVLLFGVITDDTLKDSTGSYATNDNQPVAHALKILSKRYPDLLLCTDVCLCAYTNHGHCGIIKQDLTIDNQPSINRMAEVALFYAKHGAHVVAPSDMMDGRIGAIKASLRTAGLDGRVSVMSYAAKFASVFYGPFRDAAASGMSFGDRSRYQLPPNARGLALRAIKRDVEEEGADMVMVKPGGPYLDLVRDCANTVSVPIAIYHVSGEYAMLWHAAAAGAFDLDAAVIETLNGFKRAGARILITYFTPRVLEWLHKQQQQHLQITIMD